MDPENANPTTLGALARAAGGLVLALEGSEDVPISGISGDSRDVGPGDLFVCVVGRVTDGHEHGGEAVAAGAAALCVERILDVSVPQVVVSDSRRALARLAAERFGRPAEAMLLLGVTGTNGKTTTAFLLESILSAAGRTTGLIGTIETRVAGEPRAGVRTTPDSLDLHRLLAEMRAAGVEAVAMEVTSHGLSLHRVEGLRFAAASFTNLSQDHLDFHADMEDYFEAKRSLFVPERVERGAANYDDPYGRRLLEVASIPMTSFGFAVEADLRAEDVRSGPWGHSFVAVGSSPAGDPLELKIETPLVGAFNVSNCLAACVTALLAGIDPEAVAAGIARVNAVPGRFESVTAGQPFTVVVDYSHTPGSLDIALREARRIAEESDGRVICAFGCGGDRDRGKRPLMGAAAAGLADVVIVTSDNPRSENPVSIIDDILEGIVAERPAGPDAIVVDRREAIFEAVSSARPGDVVVIAGKGHETGQEFADVTIPFDDRTVAREALADSGWGTT